jgi:peptidoglycan/LPS O-acetylase OafA/YrhL
MTAAEASPKEAMANGKVGESSRAAYLDFTRCVAIGAVLVIHFLAHYSGYVVPLFNGRANLTDVSSPVFFAVSGAALATAYPGTKELRRMAFYRKRWLRIFPVFYIAYAVGIGLSLLAATYAGNPWSYADVAPWRFIFTLFGVDGLLLANGVSTFYVLGEWFMGCIVVLYLLYPVYHALLRRSPYLVVGLAGALWLGGALLPIDYQIAHYVLMPLASFGFGAAVMSRKPSPVWSGVALAAIIALTLIPKFLDHESYNLLFGVLLAYVLGYLGEILGRLRAVASFGSWFAGISWQVILTHHVIIYYGLQLFNPIDRAVWVKVVYVAFDLMMILAASVVLKWVEERVLGAVNSNANRNRRQAAEVVG